MIYHLQEKSRSPVWRKAASAAVPLGLLVLLVLAGCCVPVVPMATAPTASSIGRSLQTTPEATAGGLAPSPTSSESDTPRTRPATEPPETRTATRTPRPSRTPTATPTATVIPAATSRTQHYYLDSQEGADTRTGLTPDEAWRTLNPLAEQSLAPGDVVHFKKGSTWAGGLVIRQGGSPAQPVVFTTYGVGKKPVFQNPEGSSGIRIEAEWVIVEGLMVRDVLEAGVTIIADHTIVQDVEVTNAGMGIAVRSQHNIIRHNYLHDLKMVRNTPGGDDDYGAVGVWLFDSYNEVAYNRMVNCSAPSYDYGTDGGGIEIFGDEVNGSYIHHNWVEDSDGGLEIGGGSARDHVIAYNVFVNNSWAIVAHLGGRYASDVSNIRFEHNTVIETALHDRPLFTFWRGAPTEDTLSMRNNIVYVLSGSVATHNGFQHTHNLYYLGEQARLGFELGTGEFVAHPRFVDIENHNFRLHESSPAVEAGIDLGYTLDFTEQVVPQGAAPDLGAFEYAPRDFTGAP